MPRLCLSSLDLWRRIDCVYNRETLLLATRGLGDIAMNRDLKNQANLIEQAGHIVLRRPLIGVTMGREKSQRFFGLSLYIMNQTYVRTLESLGALPIMIPLNMSEATLQGIFARLDGL